MKKKYHFIGIGGIGMSGLAQILIQKGCPVSGSDLSSNSMTRKLIDLGAIIYPQHSEENISADMTIVYSSDIPIHNPEYQAAVRLGCPILHRADLLAWLMQDRKTLAVTGSHGKTTTSALLTTVLVEAGESPSFAVGGIVNNYQTNAAHGSGPYFVAEADESDGSFLKYHPYAAITAVICFLQNLALAKPISTEKYTSIPFEYSWSDIDSFSQSQLQSSMRGSANSLHGFANLKPAQ